MSDPVNPKREPPAWRGWLLFALAAVVVFVLGLLVASISERRAEAVPAAPLVAIGAYESDPAKWGVNFPRQYASFREMDDSTTTTTYSGSFPRDLLAETPANVVLFAGYPFAKDYLQARGHTHALEDVEKSKRISEKTPGTCWTCKSSDVPRLMAEMGPEKFYASKFADLKDEVNHPISCLDCHDPQTMALRITRPAVIEAFQRQGKDVTKVSHQEMRSLVCAQCHVEYHFQKQPANYLKLPWDKGMTIEGMEAYYDAEGHVDWTHAISKTPMVKMQHPDYEIYAQGIHAARGVACADCHMPYKTEGGRKFSEHHLRSPLLNVANSCAVCHRWGEDDIKNRVVSIQNKIHEGRVRAEAALTRGHLDVAACLQAGATDEEVKGPRDLLRRAQMRWDYVAAHNGMGFHAPQECQRILAAANDMAQQARVEAARILARKGYTGEVQYPDFSTKEIAQAMIKQFIDGDPPRLLAAVEAPAAPTATK